MINHVRTLLLNRSALEMESVTGYEYIPADYKTTKLPPELERIRNVLYPRGLDLFGEHEITARIIQVMHSPELLPYTLSLDPRVTYLPGDDCIAKAISSPLTVSRFKSVDSDMTMHCRLGADGPTGVRPGRHRWRLSTGNVESILIQYGDNTPELHDVVARHADVTADIVLVPNYLSAYFDIPSGTLTGTYKFELDLLVPVPYNFATILEQLKDEIARPGRDSLLFANHEGLTVVADLQQVWRDSPETLMRIGAVALALAIQTHHIKELAGA